MIGVAMVNFLLDCVEASEIGGGMRPVRRHRRIDLCVTVGREERGMISAGRRSL